MPLHGQKLWIGPRQTRNGRKWGKESNKVIYPKEDMSNVKNKDSIHFFLISDV